MLTGVPAQSDLYFSADVEADGPIPGPYSMLSFGLAVAGRYDGRRFAVANPRERTFYAELRPIGEQVDPDALAVSGLDRDALKREGRDPADAMGEAAAWVREEAGDDRPVLVGYPLIYDWMFLYWYFERFARDGSPFGFSSGLDMKTMYQQKSGALLSASGKDDLPEHLRGDAPHRHHALDDAVEQAGIFARLFTWHGR
ncbi:MAG: exonuclease [Polyangiaceae bacterium]|nr:exonuclease [Polyangiaceae bacterium]